MLTMGQVSAEDPALSSGKRPIQRRSIARFLIALTRDQIGNFAARPRASPTGAAREAPWAAAGSPLPQSAWN
jgi:hypothetical protein